MPPSRPYTPLGSGVSASWMHYLIVFLLLVIGGMGIAILTLVGINKTETDKTQHQNRVIIRAIDALAAEEDTETFRCPPANPTAAPWLYQDPDTCMETMRFGIYFNVSDDNLYLVNQTFVEDYLRGFKPWLDENFAPVWRRTASFEIFTGNHLPPGNDWSPYVPIYLNDLDALGAEACSFHSTNLPNIGQGVHDVIGSWAPAPPDAWPYGSVPVGTNPPDGNVGIWTCVESRNTNYDWGIEFWNMWQNAFAHEVTEILVNPLIIDTPLVNNVFLATNYSYLVTWFFREVADGFEKQFPPYIDDLGNVACDFSYPSFFTGCADYPCVSTPPPYDFQGLTSASLMPHNGELEFYALNLITGSFELCSIYQHDNENNANPYIDCIVLIQFASDSSMEDLKSLPAFQLRTYA